MDKALFDSTRHEIQSLGRNFERRLFLYSLPIWVMYGLMLLAVAILVATKL